MIRVGVFLLLCSVLAGCTGSRSEYDGAVTVAGVAQVLGIDRLSVAGVPVRLVGVSDVPESSTSLAAWLAGRDVSCFVRHPPRPGDERFLLHAFPSEGICRVDGMDVGRVVVWNGWADVDPFLPDRYGVEQAAARAQRRGIWAWPGSSPAGT